MLLLAAPKPPVALLAAPLTTIMSVSGGLGSAFALKLICATGGKIDAVFADVKGTGRSHFWSDLTSIEELLHERYGGESRDTYRFLWQLAETLDCPIQRLEDGRSIWAIFAKVRALRLVVGKRFVCKASIDLKREVIAHYIETHYRPGTYRIALGMGVLEPHRIKDALNWWRKRLGWAVEVYSPLIDEYKKTHQAIDNCEINKWLHRVGIEAPDAYRDDFSHNNCNQICVNGAQSHYATLYRVKPLHYAYAAWQEYRWQQYTGKDNTILKDERGGTTKPMSLYEFADRVVAGDVNERAGGVCGCFDYSATLFDVEAA